MTIINMVGGGGNNINVPLNGISDLTASSGDGQSVIKRTDVGDLVVNGVTVNEWSCTKLVRKIGSAPASSNDGTPVLTETLENSYSVTGYTNTGLTNDTTYYYGAFSVGTNGLETISNIATVTPSAGGWQPGANTIAYYPLATDVNDYSGNNRNLTNHGITFSDGYAILETTNQTSTQGPYASYSSGITGYKTISCWFYKTDTTNGMLCIGHNNGAISNAYFQLRTQNPNGFSVGTTGGGTFNSDITNNNYTINFNQRHLVTITQDVAQNSGASSGNLTLYLDGNLYGAISYYMNRPLYWFGSATEGGYYYNFPGKFSNLIIEDKEWTAQEISDYYNQTKGGYGL